MSIIDLALIAAAASAVCDMALLARLSACGETTNSVYTTASQSQ